jgi:hypothetical protein
MASEVPRNPEHQGAAGAESVHQSWIDDVFDSGMALARDSFKLAATGGSEVLHDMHITNGPGADAYHFSNFLHDHRTAVNYGIDATAAVAGGTAFLVTSPFVTPVGGIAAGAGAGAGVETGLHYLIGDQVTGRQAIKGAALGAGAALGLELQAAVAARFGTSITAFAGRTIGQLTPGLEHAAARVLVPIASIAERPGISQLSAFAADRARSSLYSNLAERSLRFASEASENFAGVPR